MFQPFAPRATLFGHAEQQEASSSRRLQNRTTYGLSCLDSVDAARKDTRQL